MANSWPVFLTSVLLSGAAFAQESSAPLSAIDWLKDLPTTQRVAVEPPVSPNGKSPGVNVTPLDASTRQRLGLLSPSVTGLPANLWDTSEPEALVALLRKARMQRLPAAQDLLLLLMLTEADTDVDEQTFTLERIDTLIFQGAVDAASTLVEQANPTSNPQMFDRWMTLSLLSDSEEAPCRELRSNPPLSDDVALRIYCTARVGNFETAALLFGNAAALGEFSDDTTALLEGFLDPELFSTEDLPRPPVRPDALTFRLYESVGSSLPTAPLQRAFAHQDLSQDAGWKAQLEAAERLARAGVLPGNQLLGLYTRNTPAASGGVWDRIAALQAFETNLAARNIKGIEKTLPPMWRSMKAAELEVLFSGLFARDLSGLELLDQSARIAYWMTLLSQDPLAARAPTNASRSDLFLGSVAAGKPDAELAESTTELAVKRGFASQATVRIAEGNLGEYLLNVLVDLAAAARGDKDALANAISDLRQAGFDTEARRVAVQSLLLLDT